MIYTLSCCLPNAPKILMHSKPYSQRIIQQENNQNIKTETIHTLIQKTGYLRKHKDTYNPWMEKIHLCLSVSLEKLRHSTLPNSIHQEMKFTQVTKKEHIGDPLGKNRLSQMYPSGEEKLSHQEQPKKWPDKADQKLTGNVVNTAHLQT